MTLPSFISDTSEQIRAGTLSPVDVVNECLTEIEANASLNAFITILADQALAAARDAAREVAAGRWLGALHGIPIGIKDFYDTAGVRTTAGFKPFAHRVPAKDAIAVAQLKRAGAIIIGKTNMHELGMGTTSLVSHFGPVKNPWNAEYIAGRRIVRRLGGRRRNGIVLRDARYRRCRLMPLARSVLRRRGIQAHPRARQH